MTEGVMFIFFLDYQIVLWNSVGFACFYSDDRLFFIYFLFVCKKNTLLFCIASCLEGLVKAKNSWL